MTVLNVNVSTDYSAIALNNVTDIVMGNFFGVEAIFASTQFNNVAIKNNVNISGTQLLAHGITVNGGSVDARGWNFSNWDIVTGSYVLLNGSATNNTFYNSEVRDTINGNGGADIIYGGGGISQGDTLNGGGANDTFRYLLTTGAITDVIDGGTGTADKIKVMNSGSYDFTSATISRVEQILFGAAGQTVQLGGSQIGAGGSIQSVTGTALANALVVEGSSVDLAAVIFNTWTDVVDSITLEGTAGDDSLTGTAFADQFIATTGIDALTGGQGNDTFSFGLGGAAASVFGSIAGGGGATDTIAVTDSTSYNFSSNHISGVEHLLYGAAGQSVRLAGDQIGAFGSIQSVTGNNLFNALFVEWPTVDLSAVTFNAWTDGVDTITLEGTSGDDVLTGSIFSDYFIGTSGTDTLTGGQGDDIFSYSFGGPILNVVQTIDGGEGLADTLFLNLDGFVDFTLSSLVGVDILDLAVDGSFGSFAAGQIGSGGITSIRGSTGINSLAVAVTSLMPDIDLSGLVFTNFSFGEDVVFISGNLFDNSLVGTDYDDQINDGGGGADSMSGGYGDDEFMLGNPSSGTVVDGGDGTDTLTVNHVLSPSDIRDYRVVALNDVERLHLLDIDATVTLSSDQIGGASFLQEVDAQFSTAGALVVTGADTDLSAVTVINWNGSANTLTLEGTTGDDVLTGSMVGDIFLASDGHDTLTGGAGDDTIDGGIGNDVINGGSGADELIGGLNTDTVSYAGSSAAVTVDLALNTVSGGDAVGDTISGFERAVGSDHNDTFIGSSAANRFIGGLGQDTLTGGGGADIFRYETTADSLNLLGDIITDFVQASDRIDLGFIDADGTAGANNTFVLTANGGTAGFTGLGQLRYFVGAQNTTISLNISGDNTPDMQIVLTGLYTLTVADFIL